MLIRIYTYTTPNGERREVMGEKEAEKARRKGHDVELLGMAYGIPEKEK